MAIESLHLRLEVKYWIFGIDDSISEPINYERISMIKDCETRQDFDRLVRNSQEHPVFLLKHSTRCPISGAAWRAYQRFSETRPAAELWRVLVIENKQLSAQIAREVGIGHQSPQILLFHKGDVVWNDSHYSIKEDAMREALGEALAG